MIRREGITHIDAVIITHAHADAFLGLDDLREFCWEQKSSFTTTTSYVHPNRPGLVMDSVIPILLRKQDFPIVAAAFPYLVDSSMATGSGFVARLAFKTFEEVALPPPSLSSSSSSTTADSSPDEPSTTGPSSSASSSSTSPPSIHFEVLGLKFQTFTLEHGHNSTCTGFRFGNVVYLSDLSGLSEEVRSSIIASGPQIEILIIDALHPTEPNRSHYCLPQTLEEIRRLKPRKVTSSSPHHLPVPDLLPVHAYSILLHLSKTYLIGMSHTFEYFETNKRLGKLKETEGLDVEMSFDTLSLPIQL
jgi:phosphoribosyl 1,2-cyclic phosphodiesterase